MPGGIPVPVVPLEQPLGRPGPQQNTYRPQEHLGGRVSGQFTGGPALSGAAGAGLQNLAGGLSDLTRNWTKLEAVLDQQQQEKAKLDAQNYVLDLRDQEQALRAQLAGSRASAGADEANAYRQFIDTKREDLAKNKNITNDYLRFTDHALLESRHRNVARAAQHGDERLAAYRKEIDQRSFNQAMKGIEEDPETWLDRVEEWNQLDAVGGADQAKLDGNYAAGLTRAVTACLDQGRLTVAYDLLETAPVKDPELHRKLSRDIGQALQVTARSGRMGANVLRNSLEDHLAQVDLDGRGLPDFEKNMEAYVAQAALTKQEADFMRRRIEARREVYNTLYDPDDFDTPVSTLIERLSAKYQAGPEATDEDRAVAEGVGQALAAYQQRFAEDGLALVNAQTLRLYNSRYPKPSGPIDVKDYLDLRLDLARQPGDGELDRAAAGLGGAG